jgi:hypothetical protein
MDAAALIFSLIMIGFIAVSAMTQLLNRTAID